MSTSGALGSYIQLSPALTIFYRAAFSVVALLGICLYRGTSLKVDITRDRRIILISGLLMAAHWVTYFMALQLSTIAVGMLSVFTFPVITTFLEPIILKTRFKWSDVLLGVLVLFGTYLLIPEFTLSNDITKGAAIGLFSALLYALRNIMLKPISGRYDGTSIMFYQMVIATIVLLPCLWIYSSADLPKFIFPFILLAVITTAVGHSLFIKSFRHFSVTKASIMSTLQPFYGILLGVIFLADVPGIKTLIGGLVILVATIIVTLQKEEELARAK